MFPADTAKLDLQGRGLRGAGALDSIPPGFRYITSSGAGFGSRGVISRTGIGRAVWRYIFLPAAWRTCGIGSPGIPGHAGRAGRPLILCA